MLAMSLCVPMNLCTRTSNDYGQNDPSSYVIGKAVLDCMRGNLKFFVKLFTTSVWTQKSSDFKRKKT